MGLTDHLNNASKLSFFAWNINGLSSKSLGDKLQNVDCLNMINDFDFLIFCETWNETNIEVASRISICSYRHLKNDEKWPKFGWISFTLQE